jgi:hypothetical protein
MTKEEARAKVAGLIKDACEFSILVNLLGLFNIENDVADAAISLLVKHFAESRGLSIEEAWTLIHAAAGHLATGPWAYFILAPGRGETEIGRYLEVEPASNHDLELALERGLEMHSFDANSKQEIPQ